MALEIFNKHAPIAYMHLEKALTDPDLNSYTTEKDRQILRSASDYLRISWIFDNNKKAFGA